MKRLLACVVCIAAAAPAFAVDKIYSPYVEKGEWELEYFAHRSVDSDDSKDNGQGHKLSLGYGVTDWWKTELVVLGEKEPNDHLKFDALEWENIFQFTKKGEYWLDVGALLAYEWTPSGGDLDALETKLLLSKEIGKTYHVANFGLERGIGQGHDTGFEASLNWSSRYRYSPYFEPGFEVQSEFGKLDHSGSFNDHEHYVGPVAYGVIPFEVEDNKIEGLNYRVGYLFGVSSPASDGEVVLQLEYELEF